MTDRGLGLRFQEPRQHRPHFLRPLHVEVVAEVGKDVGLGMREGLEQGLVMLRRKERVLAAREHEDGRLHVGGVAADGNR